MEKCPRCGLMADAVETIKAERMPDADGTKRFDLVGHVYYHPNGQRCGVPKIGEAYTIYPPPKNIHFSRLLTGTGDIAGLDQIRGTADLVEKIWWT